MTNSNQMYKSSSHDHLNYSPIPPLNENLSFSMDNLVMEFPSKSKATSAVSLLQIPSAVLPQANIVNHLKMPDSRPRSMWIRLRGIALTILTALLFSLASVMTKIIPVTPFLVAVYRGIFMVAILVPFLIFNKSPVLYKGDWKLNSLVIGQGFATGVLLCFLFFTLQNMPLSECTVLTFTSPLFVAVLSRIFLKEKLQKVDYLIMVLCLCGVFLVAKPDFIFKTTSTGMYPLRNYAVVTGLGAAISVSVCMVIYSSIGTRSNWITLTIWGGALGAVISSVGVMAFESFIWPTDIRTRVYVIVLVIVNILAMLTTIYSFKFEQATLVSCLRTSEVAFSFVFQVLLFPADAISHWSVIGSSLILLSAVLATVKRVSSLKSFRKSVEHFLVKCCNRSI